MKALVIGGSGFIGSYLIEKLISNGLDVINFDLNASKIEKVKTIKGDIRIKSDLEKIESDFNRVYILAAVHRDDIQSYNKYYETNVNGLENIIDFCDSKDINEVIYYSSAAVYGDSFVNAKESDKLYPSNHYGKSKLKAELSLRKWANKIIDRKLLIIRPSVVYGLGSNSNMNRLIDYVRNNKFFIIGKGENIKSISYVQNLVDFTCYISEEMGSQITIFNYSDYPQKSIKEVCEEISYITKARKVMKVPYIFAYIFGCFLDFISFIINKKISISLGRIKKSKTNTSLSVAKVQEAQYCPKIKFSDSISKTIQY